MAKPSGILGVDHVAVFTSRIEEAEGHYAELFGATVLFRTAAQRGTWATIEGNPGWDDLRRLGVTVAASFLKAGGLTIAISEGPVPGKGGPLNHVGIGCSEAEVRRIKEKARALGLRFLEDEVQAFKFIDRFGVIWEISRGMELTPPTKRLDLRTGRIS